MRPSAGQRGLAAGLALRARPIVVRISAASVEERRQLKEDLKRAVANTARGKKASAALQAEILANAQRLEQVTPTQRPALSSLISGRWSLLYTGPGREGDVDWEKRTGGVEGPVLSFFKPITANIIRSKGITQVIDAEAGRVENLAEFRVAGAIDGYLNVTGTVSPAGDEEAVRVDVKFTGFQVKLGALPALTIPLGWPKYPTGWVDTTYLDEDTRIGRGDKGSIFVTARRGKPGQAS